MPRPSSAHLNDPAALSLLVSQAQEFGQLSRFAPQLQEELCGIGTRPGTPDPEPLPLAVGRGQECAVRMWDPMREEAVLPSVPQR
jgi:hypothetical protein